MKLQPTMTIAVVVALYMSMKPVVCSIMVRTCSDCIEIF
jgi:hypothetical protein